MSTRKPIAPIAIALTAGLVLWFVTSLLVGKREPWDAPAYWVVAYPLGILICAFLGYAYPERSWRWVLVLFETQFFAMCARNGELGGLWPLGAVLFGVIALPGVLAATLASRHSGRSAEGGA
jgi:hypothetical protein